MDTNVIYAPPTLDDIEQENLPDPEGYFFGQEEYGSYPDDEDKYDRDERDYDDVYEADFDYGFND